MTTSEFKTRFLPVLRNKIKTKEYSEKSFSKRYGNISAHKDEYNPEVFNYITIDEDVFHIAYPYEVELTKEGKSGLYGIIRGNFIKAIDLEYLKPFMDFQELEAPIQETQTLRESTYVWETPMGNFDVEFKVEDLTSSSVSEQMEWFFSSLSNKFAAKSKEYATDNWDSNFVKGGRVLGISKEQALLGYATKHLVSIMDIIDGKEATREVIDEKFGDTFIYFSLLRIMLIERIK